jgi:hypothetical protein
MQRVVVDKPSDLLAHLTEHGHPDPPFAVEAMAPDLRAGHMVIWPYGVMEMQDPEPFGYIGRSTQDGLDAEAAAWVKNKKRRAGFAKGRKTEGAPSWKTTNSNWNTDERERTNE